MANPPQIPVRDFPSPEILDGLIVEQFDNNKGDYKPIPVGTRIDEGAKSIYAGYELVAQKTTGDYRWVQRFWCNPARNQDLYNSEISYDGDDVTKPIYTRSYVERRPYTPRTRSVALKVVLGATVTNGGSGYSVAPTVTLTGGSGAGATAEAIIYRGAVVYIRITAEGDGYTTAPTVVFSSGSAAATAYISSQTAYLVKEELGKLPKDDPRFGLYDLVVRVYETLPGVISVDSEITDKDSGILVTVTKQTKKVADITPGIVITPNVSIVETVRQDIAGSTVIAKEVVTTVTQSPYHSLATARELTGTEPFEFPGYLLSIDEFVMVVDLYGTSIGSRKAAAENAIFTTREWWIIDTTTPEVVYGTATGNDVHVDEISPGDIVVNDVSYRHMLHDDATRTYLGTAITVPETTPSATEYYGTVSSSTDPFAPGTPPKWIGTEKTPKGKVDRYPLVSAGLYKITTKSTIMR